MERARHRWKLNQVLIEKGKASRMEVNSLLSSFNIKLRELLDNNSCISILDYIGRFYNHSFLNSTLIYAQKPEATKVADVNTWEKIGRKVKSEADECIWVLLPKMSNMYIIKETGNYLKRNEMTKDEQKVALDKGLLEKKRVSKGYIKVPVYDISQTEGRDIQTLGANVNISRVIKALQSISGGLDNTDNDITSIIHDCITILLDKDHEEGHVGTKPTLLNGEKEQVVAGCSYIMGNCILNGVSTVDTDCIYYWIQDNKHTEDGIKSIETVFTTIVMIVNQLIRAIEKELGLDTLCIDEDWTNIVKVELADQLLCVIEANAARVIVNGGHV